MPDASSAEATGAGAAAFPAPRALELSSRGRILLAALGFTPLLHAAAVAAPVAAAAAGRLPWPAAVAAAAAILYLLPPLAVRLAWLGRLPPPRTGIGSATFFRWWFSAQWQVIFGRLPFLEECLRLVPGLYSTWLRLWGARIGGLVYWSPGVTILDRQWLRIGKRVVFGAGVRLNAHAIAQQEDEPSALFLGAVTVGDDAMIGGYSLLLPGCEVARGERTPPLRTIHPFSRWERGRHATKTRAGLARALR